VLLNFGAVDYMATIYVNGKKAGNHTGGYFEFTLDITPYLLTNGTNELLVHVFDPTDMDAWQIPIGKQTLNRGGMIWYTPCSGIWQTVWLEAAPVEHVVKLDLTAEMDGQGMANSLPIPTVLTFPSSKCDGTQQHPIQHSL